MKYALLLIVLFSCSRPNEEPGNQTEISFDINGTHYAHTGTQTTVNPVGTFGIKSTAVGMSSYTFSGYTNGGNLIQISVSTGADTLKTTSYSNVGMIMKAGGDQYQITSGSVAISSYQNGVVSGSFSGSASKIVSINPTVTTPVTLANGIIKNVKINY